MSSGEFTNSNPRKAEVCLSSQLTLNIAAGLWVGLELGLQGLNLFLSQPWTRQVLCIFLVVHNRLMVEVDHVKRWVRIDVALHWMHHGWVCHCRIIGNGLFHGDRSMTSIRVWVVKIIHGCGWRCECIRRR